jgi:hypothetical protein
VSFNPLNSCGLRSWLRIFGQIPLAGPYKRASGFGQIPTGCGTPTADTAQTAMRPESMTAKGCL